MSKQNNYNWDGIDWASEPDSVIAQRVISKDEHGNAVTEGDSIKRPSRERVRQRRMEEYFSLLGQGLKRRLSGVEAKVQEALALALAEPTIGSRMRLVRAIFKMELPLGSRLREDFANASKVLRPTGWHSRRGTAKDEIVDLPTSVMTIPEIAAKVGVGTSYVAEALKDLGLAYKPMPKVLLKYDWSKILPFQWEGPGALSNREIADIMGIDSSSIVAVHRSRHFPKPHVRKPKLVTA